MQSSTIVTYCSHTVHTIRCCTAFWFFFICYEIQHRYYTRFKYLLILSKLYSNSLSFPLLLYGTGTILSSLREITQINVTGNSTMYPCRYDCTFHPDPLTNMVATDNTCFLLADFIKSSLLKLLSQMNRNLVGSNYGRSSIKNAHFIPIRWHRQFLFLIGRFLTIFFSDTA